MMRRDLERLENIARHWGLSSFAQPYVAREYRLPEALLHEVCHSLALGHARQDRRSSRRVGDAFDVLNDRHPVLGLTEEAFALAVEADAIGQLQWAHAVRITGLVRDVWDHGTAGRALPWRAFVTVYRHLRRSERVRELGGQAADLVTTWAMPEKGEPR